MAITDDIYAQIAKDNPKAQIFEGAPAAMGGTGVREVNEEKPIDKPAETPDEGEKPNEGTWAAPEWLKTEYKLEPKDEGEFKQYFKELVETKGKLSEHEANFKKLSDEAEKIRTENQELKDAFDPKSLFANDDEFKRQNILRKHKDIDPTTLNVILSADVKGMSAIQAVRLMEMAKNRDVYENDTQLNEYLAGEYNTEVEVLEGGDIEKLEGKDKTKLRKDAKAAKEYFTQLKADAENTENNIYQNILKERTERDTVARKRKEQWDKFSQQLPEGFKELSIPVKDESGKEVEFKFEVDGEFRKTLASQSEKIAESLSFRGDMTKEAVSAAYGELRAGYIISNLGKILTQYANDRVAEALKAEGQELHNTTGRNTQTPGKQLTDKEKQKAAAEAEIMSINKWNRRT